VKKLPLAGLAGALALFVGAVAVQLGNDSGAHAQPPAHAGSAQSTAEGIRIRRAIQNDPVAPTVAPQQHDVTIVLFSDYQCPYCRKVHPIIQALMREDPKVKLVYRDWPIFGAPSTEAARAAIASKYQGKHTAFNNALMQTQGRITSESIRAAANRAGVDWTRLQSDLTQRGTEIDQTIARSSRYAAMMGLSGTPALLIGNYLIPGAIDLPNLRKAVTTVRAEGQEAAKQ
jgi:protein-disulfide isomerase